MGRRRQSRIECFVVEVDGEPVLMRGRADASPADLQAMAEIVRAAKKQLASEPSEVQADRARRQQEALDRIHGRARAPVKEDEA